MLMNNSDKTKKIAVIYKSHYGTTKNYAEWIAETLEASLFENSDIKADQLLDYDVIVYGGGLYAGGIAGSKLVAKNPCNTLVVFTVGLANPGITDYNNILNKNFTKEGLDKIKVFHLRGGIDYSKLGFIHKTMMWAMKKETEKLPIDKRTADDHLLLETYGDKLDFTNRQTIKPLIEYIKKLVYQP